MLSVALLTLAALSSTSEEDEEFALEDDFGGMSDDLREAIRLEEAEQRKDALAAAAKEIVGLRRPMLETKNQLRVEMSKLKKRISGIKKRLNEIDRKKQYGVETGNFIPFMTEIGKAPSATQMYLNLPDGSPVDGDDYRKLCKIPDGWTPKATAVVKTEGE